MGRRMHWACSRAFLGPEGDASSPCWRVVDRVPERHPRWLRSFWEFPAFWPCRVSFDLDAAPWH